MIEEALRYDGPVQAVPRMVREPVTLSGVELPENAFVLVLLGAANRDPERFPDPDRFDIHRNPQGHLAFGFGAHFCLGASLARLEARVAFEELLQRCRDLSAEEHNPAMNAGIIRGPQELPIAFSPA